MQTETDITDLLMRDMASMAPAIGSDAMKSALPVTITVARALYKRMTALPAYTQDQIEHHNHLITAYQKLSSACNPSLGTHKQIIPEGWKLDVEFRPIHTHDLIMGGINLLLQFENLSIRPSSIHLSAKGMLSTIIKLFDSLSNRTVGKLQKGCIEGMFFSELAHWIVIELPTLHFDTEEDLIKLRARRTYCHTVHTQVLVRDSTTERNNPMEALSEIIVSLDAIIEATEDLIQLTSFRSHGAQLDDAILGMIAETFQVMRLMIDGDHELELPVHLLLDDEQTYRPKINEFKQKRLAIWLKSTLTKLDIRSNDFIAHKSISLTESAHHLDGECIDDTVCNLPKILKENARHAAWGHWEFMLTNIRDEPINMLPINQMIRGIYKNILNLHYARGLLSYLCKISPIYGDAWLYKDKGGKIMISMLTGITKEMEEYLKQSLTQFFEYTLKLFDAKVSRAKIKEKNRCYKPIRTAQIKYAQFLAYGTQVDKQITLMAQKAEKFESNLVKTDDKKRLLLKAIIEYVDYRFAGRSEEYPKEYTILREMLGNLKSTSSIPTADKDIPPTPAAPQSIKTKADYKGITNTRLIAARDEGNTILNLNNCGLSQLSRRMDISDFYRELRDLPKTLTIADLSHNKFHGTWDDDVDKTVALDEIMRIVSYLPSSVSTLYLQGNGLERYLYAELKGLFTRFPKNIHYVSLAGEAPLPPRIQLERIHWPQSYYNLSSGAGNFIDMAKKILNDYTKGNSTLKLIFFLHWNRHHIKQVQDIVKRIETMDPQEVMNELEKIIHPKTNKSKEQNKKPNINPCGSLARRYTFLQHLQSATYHMKKTTTTEIQVPAKTNKISEPEIETTTIAKHI